MAGMREARAIEHVLSQSARSRRRRRGLAMGEAPNGLLNGCIWTAAALAALVCACLSRAPPGMPQAQDGQRLREGGRSASFGLASLDP